MDDKKLIAFLNQGKSLFIDGNNFGFDNGKTEMYKMSGCKYAGWGSPLSENITTLVGKEGTITSGKSYTFIRGVSTNASIDHITSETATTILTCQDGKGRGAVYEGQNGSYRFIYLSFIFGNLRGLEQKNELMNAIMKYLTKGTTPISDGRGRNTKGDIVSMHMIPRFFGNGSLSITLSHPSWVYINCLNPDGTRVGRTIEKYLFSGKNDLHFPFDLVDQSKNGLRILKVVTKEGCESRTFLVLE